MAYLLVRHRVVDFERWKRVFDSHTAAQREAGLKVQKVLRNVDDPAEVVLFFEVADVRKARAFVTSPTVPDAQEQSGVIGRPETSFLE